MAQRGLDAVAVEDFAFDSEVFTASSLISSILERHLVVGADMFMGTDELA
jgi:hypothetical protein